MADLVKSSHYRQQACNCSIETASPDLRSPNRNPEQAVIAQDEQNDLTILTSANGVLTKQESLILYYSFYEDLAPQEIAMVLPEKTAVQISGIRFRALSKLRDFLVGRGYCVLPRFARIPPRSRLVLKLPHGLVVQVQTEPVSSSKSSAAELNARSMNTAQNHKNACGAKGVTEHA
jgi:hypothetical protein